MTRIFRLGGLLIAALVIVFAFAGKAEAGGKADLKPGDVLLGYNSKETAWVIAYGGVRHAAVWDGTQVIEGGVAYQWDNFWPRGRVQAVTYESFVRRYDSVYVYRSNWFPPGKDIAKGARTILYYGDPRAIYSCVELVEYARYLATERLVRYWTPSRIAITSDFFFVTIAR